MVEKQFVISASLLNSVLQVLYVSEVPRDIAYGQFEKFINELRNLKEIDDSNPDVSCVPEQN